MDDLDLIREHIPEAPAPGDDAKQRAAARLAQAMGDEARRATNGNAHQTLATRLVRPIQTRRRSMTLAFATVIAAAAAALFLSTPWKASPGFLERAEAALPAPKGRILYVKSEFTSTSTDPACTVTFGPNERWVDQTPPYRFRAVSVEPDIPDSDNDLRDVVCARGTRTEEIGGPLNARIAQFEPPNTLLNMAPVGNPTHPRDPVAQLRADIRAGRAHDEGKTTLSGRTVERIRIDPPRPRNCAYPCGLHSPAYIYVDPDTYYPVEMQGHEVLDDGDHVVRVGTLVRYLRFEYLPRTDANLALTDIRAQHPNACLRDFWGPGSKTTCG